MAATSTIDQYSNLPDDLLEEILKEAPSITGKLRPIFENLENHRSEIHSRLDSENLIRSVNELENTPSPSVAAIDGGQAIEKTIGIDVLMAVGVGVEGLVREDKRRWSGIQHKNWQDILPHHSESNPKIVRAAMTALELLITSTAPHDVVIADGSHQSPVIGINSLTSMSTLDDEHHARIMLSLMEDLNVASTLKKAMESPNIIYMVKYDSSQEIGNSRLHDFGLTVDDKTVMTMILRPDEFTKPLRVGQTPRTHEVWKNLNISISSKLAFNGDRAEALRKELNFAITVPKSHRIYFTYYKPFEWSPAFRIELKEQCARSEFELAKVLRAIKEQVVSAEIQEPYPQYLADMMAKSISGGLTALRSVVQSQISDNQNLVRLISLSYRTY